MKEERFIHPRWWLIWVTYGLIRVLVMLPYRWQWHLGRFLGRVFYHTARRRRHIAAVNIALCFPELDKEDRTALLKKTFESNIIGYFETAMAWWYPADPLNRVTKILGLEHLYAAKEKGKGVILLGAHFSTLDLGGLLFSHYQEVDAVYRPHNNPLLEKIICRGRGRYFGKSIDRKDIRSVIRSLRQNRCVWYAPDQDLGLDQSVFAPFFGVETATVSATSRLVKLNDSPILMLGQYRNEDGSGYTMELYPPLSPFPTGDEVDDAAMVNKAIETCIRKHPDQYLWLHRRFKTRPDGSRNTLYETEK